MDGRPDDDLMLTALAAVAPGTALRDGLAGRGVALTTVHTVLTRLEQKGFVVHDDRRPRRFAPRATREAHAAELMHEVLGQAGDRQAALARFVGSVDAEDAAMLRELLGGGAAAGPDATGAR